MFCTTVPSVPNESTAATSAVTGFSIFQSYKSVVDFVIDDGARAELSTVIDLTDVNNATVLRIGSGSIEHFREYVQLPE